MTVERVEIGTATLYLGDCLEVRPTLGHVEAVVSDPPYGMAFDFTKASRNVRPRTLLHCGPCRTMTTWDSSCTGDTERFDPSPWLAYPQIILWGANHYASRLPDSGAWLIWDKRVGRISDSFSDCELAWSNLGNAARVHRQLWRGMVRAGEDNPVHGPKKHPAQKPIELMLWCVGKTTGTVLDPYMGSGTTGVACVRLGRPFIGVEIEEKYWQIACRRIDEASTKEK
jgi:site-specific DNA-methyltransferase (adenine-specific)/modification methylase